MAHQHSPSCPFPNLVIDSEIESHPFGNPVRLYSLSRSCFIFLGLSLRFWVFWSWFAFSIRLSINLWSFFPPLLLIKKRLLYFDAGIVLSRRWVVLGFLWTWWSKLLSSDKTVLSLIVSDSLSFQTPSSFKLAFSKGDASGWRSVVMVDRVTVQVWFYWSVAMFKSRKTRISSW